jgi:hypothetical protein
MMLDVIVTALAALAYAKLHLCVVWAARRGR